MAIRVLIMFVLQVSDDGLVSNDQKQILLSPTWRMYNAMPVTTSEGEQRAYNPDFKNTVYYKIYNDLINNEKLIATAKECGYKIKYLLHPIVSAQAKDYTPNSAVEVIPSVGDLSYEKILTESSHSYTFTQQNFLLIMTTAVSSMILWALVRFAQHQNSL